MHEADKLKLKRHVQFEIDRLGLQIASMESLAKENKEDLNAPSDAAAIGVTDKHALSNACKRLNILQHSLECIDDESYGLCVVCGANIPVERLMIVPEARLCIEHAEEEQQ